LTQKGIVQYDALQWAWTLAKEYDTCVHCTEMRQFRDHVSKILTQISEEGELDLRQLLKDLRAGDF
jgi:hypothetical protein